MKTLKCERCGKETVDDGSNRTKKYCSSVCRHRAGAHKYYLRHKKRDRRWSAEKQKRYRQKNPERYAYMMARYYFKRLSKDKRHELIMEVCR